MKKFLSVILCLTILSSAAAMFSFSSFAGTDPTLRVVGTTINAGDSTAEISVQIENNPGIWSTQLFFIYDNKASYNDFIICSTITEAAYDDPADEENSALRDKDVSSSFGMYGDLEDALNSAGIDYSNKKMTVVTVMNPKNKNLTGNGTLFKVVLNTANLEIGEYDINIVYSPKQTVNFNDERVTFDLVQDKLTVVGNEHDFSVFVQTVAPTCTEGGYDVYKCSKCDETENRNFVEALGHMPGNAVEENRVEPTCTSAGSYDSVVYCTRCSAELSRETIEIDCLGHNYVGAETEPTCTEGGFTTYTCGRCGDSYVGDETEPLGHEFADGEPYCLHGCGTANPDYVEKYTVTCDGEVIGEFEAGEAVTLPTLALRRKADSSAYRFFTWSGADVVRGKYNKANTTPNGRIYTMTMPESDVTLTPVYLLVSDANGDGKINTRDLIELKKIIAGSVVPDDAGNDRADLNCDDRVNTSDVIAMKKLFTESYIIVK